MRDRMLDVCETAAAAPARPARATPDRVDAAPGTSRGMSRRRVLAWCAAAVALPPALAACSAVSGAGSDDAQTLLALADQARSDAALVVAAVTEDPALAGRLEPLRAARIEHAAALDAAGGRTEAAQAAAVTEPVDLARVRAAVVSSARSAGDAVPGASADRVGLLAEVAACCATYGAVLA